MEVNYVIALCLVFIVFLVIKEGRRSDKSKLLARLIASIVMISSFALLVIPIKYSIKKLAPVHELNILTEGTPIDVILALKSAKYDLDSTLFPKSKNLGIRHLPDLSYHLSAHPEIRKINVYGYGLSSSELNVVKDCQLSFRPAVSPLGIISASWPKKVNTSEQLIVQGIYNNPSAKGIKLKLFGFGAGLDSVVIKANTKVNFSFSNQPKQIGKAVFNLIALQGQDTLSAEPVPFEVEKKAPIRVLILASFPDFEFKFLKRWLYENQYEVAFSSRISKDKYSIEFLNRKTANLNQLSQAFLKGIDLVILDEEELKPEILSAVTNGMGLIIRAKAIKKGGSHQPLLSDTAGKITVDSRLSGMGKIVTTTLSSTYEWQLAGKTMEYGRFWSLLFAKALRKKIEESTYFVEPKWPRVGEKTRLMMSVADVKPPVIWMDSAGIAPRQNMELPFVWDGFYWSKKSGWATLSINQKMDNIYSYKKTDWNAIKNFDKLRATSNFVANQSSTELKANKIEILATEELHKGWFFIIFLLAISFLWYEQRFLAYN